MKYDAYIRLESHLSNASFLQLALVLNLYSIIKAMHAI